MLAVQGEPSLRERDKHPHQSYKEAWLGLRAKFLTHFIVGSGDQHSYCFILAEGHKSAVPTSEGHRNSHGYLGCNRSAGGEYLNPITCAANHSVLCATSCTLGEILPACVSF